MCGSGSRMLLVVLGMVVSVLPVAGQAPLRPGITPNPRPSFSPYMNLLLRNGSPALNYYGIVRPQLQTASAINALQSELALNRDLINAGQLAPLGDLSTGHAAVFLNTGGYFMNMTGSGSVGSNAFIPGRGAATPLANPAGGTGIRMTTPPPRSIRGQRW
jgi:hypothetical protein